MRAARINGRWPLFLPQHRIEFHEGRPWWEAARLSDMYHALSDLITDDPNGYGRQPRLIDVGSEEGDLSALYASWGCEVSVIDPSRPWIQQTLDIFEANRLVSPMTFTGFAADHTDLELGWANDKGFARLEERPDIARIKLDDWLKFIDFPDAVTMDVEGAEDVVLAGATNLLAQGCVWWISIHGDVDPHASMPSAIHETMRGYGYKDQWLGHQHEWFYRFYR